MAGLDWSHTGAAATGPADEIFLDSYVLAQHVEGLRSHAAAMRAYGAMLTGRVAALG